MTSLALRRMPILYRAVRRIALVEVAFITIVIGCGRLTMFQIAAIDDSNPSTWENWVYWSLAAAAIVYSIGYSIFVSNYSASRRFNKRLDAVGLSVFEFWFAVLALFPAIAMVWVDHYPHRLYVPNGYFRVMNDHRVFYPGQSVESDRYHASSVLMPLAYNGQKFTRTFNTPAGAVRMHVTLSFALKPGDSLASLFSELKVIPRHTDMTDEEVVQAQARIFSDRAASYLEPQLRKIVGELQAGMIDGSESKLTVRLTQLLAMHPEKRPPWLSYIRVSDVSAVQGTP